MPYYIRQYTINHFLTFHFFLKALLLYLSFYFHKSTAWLRARQYQERSIPSAIMKNIHYLEFKIFLPSLSNTSANSLALCKPHNVLLCLPSSIHFEVLGLLADCSRFSKSQYVQRFGLHETEEFLWECFHCAGQVKFYYCPLSLDKLNLYLMESKIRKKCSNQKGGGKWEIDALASFFCSSATWVWFVLFPKQLLTLSIFILLWTPSKNINLNKFVNIVEN